jgi:beta-1,4-N-acetylglucosaminyltransferase
MAAAPRTAGEVDVLLVCSSGGHLLQLNALASAWSSHSRAWVSFDKPDVRALLADEDVVFAFGPTNRSIANLLRNARLAVKVLRARRPAVIVTTGAGVAVPFAWVGRLVGARVVYIESVTRFDSISLSCRLVRPVATRLYVQWEEMLSQVSTARYAGAVFAA